MASVTGGTKLATVLARITTASGTATEVSIGFLAGATYPDGASVPMVAALNEFGVPSKGQPPRPFFRDMIAAKSMEWPGAVAGLLPANGYDAGKVLDLAGQAIKGQLQNSIQTFDRVPLAASTIKAKGFEKQLVDTGVMAASVDYRVD